MKRFTILDESIFENRVEARGLTIDGPGSLDLDDAIWIEKLDPGLVIHVSIADVAFFIKPNTRTDKMAEEKGMSHYFAGGQAPMLPRSLSEDSLSLHQDYKRPTITISIQLDNNLEIHRLEIKRTFVKSRHKLSYEEADKFMESGEDPMLIDAYQLAQQLFENRKAHGAIVFFDKRTGLISTEDGHLVFLDESRRFNSHILVQEFMILANRAVAEFFVQNNISGLFRNHNAKASAPDRKELQADMETALFEGNPHRISTLRQRLSLLMERSSYATTLSGHYGLNLPAYMHITSPIRRFADLINHRQLIAHIESNGFPYNIPYLDEIAGYLNKKEDLIRQRKARYFKRVDEERTRKTIDLLDYENLNSRDFYRVIQLAARDGIITAELENAIESQFRKDALGAREFYTIFFESKKDNKKWAALRLKVLSWLESRPAIAISIITMARQTFQWPGLEYDTGINGPSHNPRYTSKASLNLQEKTYTSARQTANSKKEAEQYAALGLLESILGNKSKSRDFSRASRSTGTKSETERNPKGALIELCKMEGWDPPKFRSSSSGPSHRPRHEVIGELVIEGEMYVTGPVTASSIKKAEQLAAAELLEKTSALLPAESGDPRIKVHEENHIGALQELMQRHQMELPSYTFQEHDGQFLCNLTVLDPAGGPRVFSATAKTKKLAKNAVSSQAFWEMEAIYREDT